MWVLIELFMFSQNNWTNLDIGLGHWTFIHR